MAVFVADIEVKNVSNCNRNATILLKMRGKTTCGNFLSRDMGFLFYFQPFSAILASFQMKMPVFEADIEVQVA